MNISIVNNQSLRTIAVTIALFSLIFIAASGGNFQKASFKVQGNCSMCKKRIESALQVNGVMAALWNPDSKMLKVKYEPAKISVAKMRELVAKAGYDSDSLKAATEDYNRLEKCCQYRSGKCEHR